MERTLQQEATLEQAVKLGLLPEEFKMIETALERTPSLNETIFYSLILSDLSSDQNQQLKDFLNPETAIEQAVLKLGLNGEDLLTDDGKDAEEDYIDLINSVKQPDDLKEVAIKMLQLVASRKANGEKETNTLTSAELLALNELQERYIYALNENTYFNANAEKSILISVADALRKVVCSGAVPNAIVSRLTFSELNDLDRRSQAIAALKGLNEASLFLNSPIKGSYIELKSNTPRSTLGVVGLVPENSSLMTKNFKQKGDLIFIIGESTDDISASEYLTTYHQFDHSQLPYFNLEKEFALQQTILGLIQNSLVNAVHDISIGGLFITLVEMSIPENLGFDIVTDSEVREDSFLFGEGKGRVIVSVSEDQEEEFIEFMMNSGVSFTLLGHVTKGKMMVDDEHFGFVAEAKELYSNAKS
jgi:phosphoribosylformylglycinamidine synthase subunit PurL